MKNYNVLKVAVFLFVVASFGSVGRVFADDQKTDGEIAAILMASDRNEVGIAEQAEGKNVSPDVLDYAKMLQKDHTDDLNKIQSIVDKDHLVVPSTAGTMVKAKGAKNMTMLTFLDGQQYDKSFIDAMVKDHQEDLDMIDNDLMKDVQNADLKAQLQDTRSAIQKHLDKAKDLQTKLGGSK